MATLPQPELFSWEQLDSSPDLKRLQLMLGSIPDEVLMQTLEEESKGRRDDYPIRALWNSILAGVVFQHVSIESPQFLPISRCPFLSFQGDGFYLSQWLS